MKLVFTFDDGRSDSYLASQIMNTYGLKGTFFITTGFIDGTFVTNKFGFGRKPLSVKELKEMDDAGHEIASHGDRHITSFDDFSNSIKKIEKWGLLKKIIGFSIPNSDCNNNDIDCLLSKANKLKYIRHGRNIKCYSFLSKMHYALYHFFHFQLSYNAFNKHNLIKTIDSTKQIDSLVIKKTTSAKSIISFIDKFKKSDYLLVLMFHSIVEKPTNNWEWSIKNFEMLCQYIKNQESIKNDTLMNFMI